MPRPRPQAAARATATSSGSQTPAARSSAPRDPSTSSGCPSASSPPVAPSTTTRSTTGSHTDDAMLDHDERRAGLVARRLRHGVAHLVHAGGIEVRRRLVEQDEAGAHREHPGERESLPLPARERGRGVIEREIEADRVERGAHARPDLVARDPEVLESERDVVADVAPSPPGHRDPAARGRSGRGTPTPADRRRAARRATRRRRRRRARPPARAGGWTCPPPTRRAAAPVRPAGCRGRGRARRARVARRGANPSPAP